MKELVIVKRYSGKVDQEFFDLEFARMDQESEMESQFDKEELTRIIITGKGEYYWKK